MAPGSEDRWVRVGRGSTQDEVRGQLERWCSENGWPFPPPGDEVRWNHGLAEDGDYWDVWVRVPAGSAETAS